MRRSLAHPIPEIFAAAERLNAAVDAHLAGRFDEAERLFAASNDPAVWAYTDRAWGKGAKERYRFKTISGSPPLLPANARPRPRMPTLADRTFILARDGHHCRFCGIPVIDPAIRTLASQSYPAAVRWGTRNVEQHAAFQCMWLQFDHVLPNGRGGDSSPENVVVACAPCNFGRMEATLDEAELIDPRTLQPPVLWSGLDGWDGLERLRQGHH